MAICLVGSGQWDPRGEKGQLETAPDTLCVLGCEPLADFSIGVEALRATGRGLLGTDGVVGRPLSRTSHRAVL